MSKDCVKCMVVCIDSSIDLEELLRELGLECRVLDHHFPGIVWKRKLPDGSEGDETELLVVLEAKGFAGLVHYSKQVKAGNALSSGALTLVSYINKLHSENGGKKISVAVEDMEAFFRGSRTKENRRFRQAVLGSAGTSDGDATFSDVSRVDVEEAVVALQLETGCVMRLCKDKDALAEYILTLTKALAEAPHKKSNHFSFFAESGAGASKKELKESSNQVALVWKHQLMQFNNFSENMAGAVVSVYPSPVHLLSAYESCEKELGEMLLKDIVVRRGVGTTSSTRKLGPVQSKRIYTFMTATDGTKSVE